MTSIAELKSKTAQLPPIDPDVQLPAAIRAAAARSNSLHQEAYTPNDAQSDPTTDPAANGEEGKPQEPQPEANPAAPQNGTEDRSPAPSAQTPVDPEDWENRYKRMKGQYDRAEQTNRGLVQRLGDMERTIAQLTEQAKTPKQVPTPDLKFKPVSAEERETYGDDFLDIAARAATERLNPEFEAMRQEIASLRGQLGNVTERTQATSNRSMFEYLDGELANWREINRSPEFLAWANLQDPLSGGIRISMMRDAFAQGDAPRVLRFFQGFLMDEATTAPSSASKQDNPSSDKVPLETFAAPGRAKAPAATPAPGEKETISRAQISAFYANVNKGVYKGNEAEKNRLEQMIFEAEAEGRIV